MRKEDVSFVCSFYINIFTSSIHYVKYFFLIFRARSDKFNYHLPLAPAFFFLLTIIVRNFIIIMGKKPASYS